MKIVKKILILILMFSFIFGFDGYVNLKADETAVEIPVIKVRSIENGTGVKIIIGKNENAEGYEISWVYGGNKFSASLYAAYGFERGYGPYNSYSDTYYYDNYSGKSKISNPYDFEKTGSYVRKCYFYNLQPGTYKFKVRAYKIESGKKVYSGFSKEVSITLKGIENKTGYLSSYDFSNISTGDIIKFGAYEQDKDYTNGKEPIEWIVLSKTDKEMLVLSRYCIDKLPYHKRNEDITWANCTLRSWLNGAFYNSAFNSSEKKLIKNVKLENRSNEVYNISGGRDTYDNIFLLSQRDMIKKEYGFAEKYSKSDVNRRCTYAWNTWKTSTDYPTAEGQPSCWWWLRTPGHRSNEATVVYHRGYVDSRCYMIDTNGLNGTPGVRPALYIKLES